MKTLQTIGAVLLTGIVFLVFYVNRVLKSFIPSIPLDRWKHYRGIHEELTTIEVHEENEKGLQRDILFFILIVLSLLVWFFWSWITIVALLSVIFVLTVVAFWFWFRSIRQK